MLRALGTSLRNAGQGSTLLASCSLLSPATATAAAACSHQSAFAPLRYLATQVLHFVPGTFVTL